MQTPMKTPMQKSPVFRSPVQILTGPLLAVLLLMLSAGCCPKGPGQFAVNVKLADSFKDKPSGYPSVPVQIIAANSSQYGRLMSMGLTKYWQQNGTAAPSDRKTLSLSAAKPSGTLAADDPLWTTWKEIGATHLFIIANWPRDKVEDKEGGNDTRRVVVPLELCRWKDKPLKIDIEIDDSGVNLMTPPNPAE